MRYKVFTTMMFFGLLILPTARAQSGEAFQVDIPFDFGVSNIVLPAGNYQLTYSLNEEHLFIRGFDQRANAIVPKSDIKRSRENKRKLVFNCYGGTCFLSEVWQGLGESSVIELPKTTRERHLIARIASPGMELASITVPVR